MEMLQRKAQRSAHTSVVLKPSSKRNTPTTVVSDRCVKLRNKATLQHKIEKMVNVEEYANAKGIPMDSVPADVYKKAQGKSFAIRQAEDPMADTFRQMCTKSQELLAACTSESGSSDGAFPAACSDIAVKHMECLINKRETAYQIAVKLAGKEKCETVFPYYEDNKKKALDMIKIYKDAASEQKSPGFWG